MILSRLDRYIGAHVVLGTLWVLGVLAALFVFFTVIDALGDYGQGNFGFAALLQYVLLSQPLRLYEILPVAAVIGASLGLASLALSYEITAMRAAGVAPRCIVGAALKAALVFAVIGLALGEYVVPQAESLAQLQRAQALQTGLAQRGSGLWLRDGQEYVNIGEVLTDLSLLRVHIYRAGGGGGAGRISMQIYAERARYASEGYWRLEEVHVSHIAPHQVTVERRPALDWHTGITPKLVAVFAVRPEALSLTQLAHFIAHLESHHLDARRYRLSFWHKLLLPLAVAVMVLAATPFVFHPVRSGGLAQRVFIGVVLGLGFLVVQRSLGNLGLLYGLPPFWAAALPVAGFFLLAALLLRRATR